MERLAFTARTIARFWAKVDKSKGTDACWPYTGSVNERGYGIFFVGEGGPSNWVASRFAFAVAVRDPGDLLVCHKCDNPPCCNPAHLFAGTQAENIADCIGKDRKIDPPVMFGAANPAAKLSAEVAADLRRDRAAGLEYKALAQRYGVSKATVWRVLAGQSWEARA